MAEKPNVNVGLIGVGGIAAYVHYPGVQTAPGARVLAMTDTEKSLLQEREREWSGVRSCGTVEELLGTPGLDAVIVATPNCTHLSLVLSAVRAGKHVLCEKPLAMNLGQAREMLDAARAAGVRHMTAFTYRLVPAMRYLKHLIERGDLGQPLHFRAQRFQDWHVHSLGWRQWRDTAGTGELGDMASHRIDYAHFLIGPIRSVCGMMKQFVPRDTDEDGRPVRPSDTDDWVGFVAEFARGVTGVFESSKLARGHGSGGHGHDCVEVNGTDASAIYQLRQPYELQIGRRDSRFETVKVPESFWKLPGSLRVAGEGDPSVVWRYDQAVEFIESIREGRDARPSFVDGVRCQAVIDAVVRSVADRRWVEVESE
ncbi:MAG: Gfo/Idh/MocA family oxidoreductase [Planctomycetes bacterium]|nr:Gfo/Idh/MocA family oxidoreductase [Planctomycetota bacterium]